MTWQRPEWLSVIAIGTNGGQRLADGSTMEPGVHLRWQLGDDLGFPVGGFDIYRREHMAGTPQCADFREWRVLRPVHTVARSGFTFKSKGAMETGVGCGGNALTLRGKQSVQITLPVSARSVVVTLAKGSSAALGVGLLEDDDGSLVTVAEEEAVLDSSGNRVITLYADRIDRVHIDATDMRLCRVCTVSVDADIDNGWVGPYNKFPIYLPITSSEWPTRHASAPNDRAEADARLSARLSATARTRYLNGFSRDLRPILGAMVATDSQQLYALDESGVPTSTTGAHATPSRFTFQGLQLLSLTALDPNLARIIGVYFRDDPGAGLWDYRVVGHWGSARYPGTYITFDALTAERRYALPLTHEGLQVISSRHAVATSKSWGSSQRLALLLAGGMHASPVWIKPDAAAPAVTLEVEVSGATLIQGFHEHRATGAPIALAAGEHTVNLDAAAGIDTIAITTTGDVLLFAVMLRRAAGTIGDVNAVSFRHQKVAPVAVRIPSLEIPVALPGRTRLAPDGTVSDSVSAVGLHWTQFAATGWSLPGTPILFRVQRDSRGTGATPAAPTTARVLNSNRPTLVATSNADGTPPAELRPSGWPTTRMHYVDRDLSDGWYGYAVLGIDLFGRVGNACAAQAVQVLDQVAPPPPSAIAAKYIDPDDPWLTPAEASWAAANGAGLRFNWTWPGAAAIQAPDASAAGEFRVYWIDGRLNTIAGEVKSVSYTSGASTAEITTDQSWNGTANQLAGEYIRVGDSYFKVTANTAGSNFQLTVENLTNPRTVPSTDTFVLTFSVGKSYRTDYRAATTWDERIHVEPMVPVTPTSGNVSTVATLSDGTHVVTATVAMSDPEGVLTPGVLVCNGVPYRATKHVAGAKLKVWVHPLTPPTSTSPMVAPKRLQTLVYYPGRAYEVYLSDISLSPPAGEGTVIAHVAVSAADGRSYVADDPFWSDPSHGSLGGRTGNEGSCSRACKIVAPRYSDGTTPAAPVAPAAGAPIYADAADYYGDAHYLLEWTASTDPDADAYAIYRCSTAALFDRDRDQRQRLVGEYSGSSDPFADDAGFDDWFTAWAADNDATLTRADLVVPLSTSTKATTVVAALRDWAARFYPSLDDGAIQELANREGNEAALRRINADPFEDTRYTDTIDGRGAGAYVYRVRTLDASGNLGPWSDAFPPVHTYDVTAPAMPTILSVVAGDRSTTLTWGVGIEPDLTEYWVYRAESEEALSDWRHESSAVTKITVGADSSLSSATYTDAGLDGLRAYYYRLAAVDANGNGSTATPVLQARPYDQSFPDIPELAVSWSADANSADAAWIASDESLLERATEDGLVWSRVTDWLAAGTHAVTDDAESTSTWRYRLRTRKSTGAISVGEAATLEAATETA